MNLHKAFAAAVTVALVLVGACTRQDEPAAQHVRPGDKVRITFDELELARGMNLAVTVGGVLSRHLNIVDDRTMEIGIPLLAAGEAKVEIRAAGKVFDGPTYVVTPLPLLSVSMYVTDDTTIVMDSKLTDEPLPSAPASVDIKRISYDFFSEDGLVSFLTTIPHPLNEAEDTDGDYEFHVVIPRVQGRGILRVFEAHAGLDINEGHNAHRRKLLSEYILPLEK